EEAENELSEIPFSPQFLCGMQCVKRRIFAFGRQQNTQKQKKWNTRRSRPDREKNKSGRLSAPFSPAGNILEQRRYR
ncbi:hypothetical protein, partial [Ruminococcus sp.]|uniref:hypothetical protein n=1 Tax=Ruminococcus sp. TaxID=41978 RepID=UPI003AF523B8